MTDLPENWTTGDTLRASDFNAHADRINDQGDEIDALEDIVDDVELGQLFRPASLTPYPLSDVVSYTAGPTAPVGWNDIAYYTIADSAARFRIGGQLTPVAGVDAATRWNQINGATGGQGITGFEVEFFMTGPRGVFRLYSFGANDIQILVDDMPLYPPGGGLNPVHLPDSVGEQFVAITFATSRVRRIRAIFGQVGMHFFAPSGVVWPAPPRFKMAVISDSYFHGAGDTTEGSISALSMFGQTAMKSGAELWMLPQGGTGYVNPGGNPPANGESVFGSLDRRTALAALPAMDAILVFGGANDVASPVGTVVAAANACWNALHAARPNTPLIVAGIQPMVYPASAAALDTLNAALKAAAGDNPNVHAFIDMRNPNWITGSGNVSSPAYDGPADIFMSSDTVHPTHAGFEAIAARFVRELAKVRIEAA